MSIMAVRFFIIAFFATLLCTLAAPTSPAARSLEKRHSGTGTWFEPDVGNCGWRNKSTDMIVALPTSDYDGGKHCGKKIKIKSEGKTHTAEVVDRCPDCHEGSLDMSPSLFKEFASLGKGEIKVTWSFE
ncbi:hypothetical protein HWV62_29497 [Athelia sp. TMB]|nr:hypothetical protein HWV62_29497 [Athelia sp. TMB]